MSKTVTISDESYRRLEKEARARGLASVEELFEQLGVPEVPLSEREEVVARINSLRGRLLAKYGEMPYSTDILREDRAR
jgi:hypothetical protein